MLKIAVVDELCVLERFEGMLSNLKGIKICGLFQTGKQLLAYMEENTVDAVFLDIELPDINGLFLSQHILKIDENIKVIFITAFKQYAIEAFEHQAMDYILKPLAKERLEKTIIRLLKDKGECNKIGKPYIQCLGEFEVFINGEALKWKNTKAKEILAFLVHKKGVPVNWEKIATAVWPDYDSEKAQTNFHATTYLLRKRLAEAGIANIFEGGRGNYRVIIDELDCDIYNLENRLNSNKMNRKEDIILLEQLDQRGYMEGDGYEWAYSRAAELDCLCKRILDEKIW